MGFTVAGEMDSMVADVVNLRKMLKLARMYRNRINYRMLKREYSETSASKKKEAKLSPLRDAATPH